MGDVPPPRITPQPFPSQLGEEPPTDPGIRLITGQVRRKIKPEMRRELNWQGAKLTVAMVVVATGTAFGAYRAILSEAAAQTDAGVRVHEQRISTLEVEQKEIRADVHEVQQDIRSLYKAVMTRQPQERLERPPPQADGGIK